MRGTEGWEQSWRVLDATGQPHHALEVHAVGSTSFGPLQCHRDCIQNLKHKLQHSPGRNCFPTNYS